jgi:hypothetical protein
MSDWLSLRPGFKGRVELARGELKPLGITAARLHDWLKQQARLSIPGKAVDTNSALSTLTKFLGGGMGCGGVSAASLAV